MASHLLNTATVLQQLAAEGADATALLAALLRGGFSEQGPCQTSISTDVLGTAASLALYIIGAHTGCTPEANPHQCPSVSAMPR